MGHNRTWPIVLRYETHKDGELQMKKLEIKALINKIQSLKTLMHKDKTQEIDNHHVLLVSTHYRNIIPDS